MRSIIIIGTYTALNLLAVLLLDRWLCKCGKKYRDRVGLRAIIDFLYLSVAFVPVMANFVSSNSIRFGLEKFSYAWLGFLMYFGGLLLLVTIVDLGFSFAKFLSRKNDGFDTDDDEDAGKKGRRAHAVTMVLLILITVGVNVYGAIHAQDTVIKEYDIKIDKKVERTERLKVALISDIHIAYNSSKSMLKRMVELTNEQKPDVIIVAGDLISSDYYAISDPKGYASILSKLDAKEGVYWVYGNHDVQEPLFCGFALEDPKYALRTKEIEGFIKKCGFTPLEDEAVSIADGEVQLAGRLDYSKNGHGTNDRKDAAELLNDLDKNKPILIADHEPRDYKALSANGADISMSGHTHAGQVFPGTIVTRMLNDMVYGLDTREGMQVLVTSGVGYYGAPLRIGTNSEVVIANFTFKTE